MRERAWGVGEACREVVFVRASGGRRSVGDGAVDGALADRELAQSLSSQSACD